MCRTSGLFRKKLKASAKKSAYVVRRAIALLVK